MKTLHAHTQKETLVRHVIERVSHLRASTSFIRSGRKTLLAPDAVGAEMVSPPTEGKGSADMASISRRRCSRVFPRSRYDVPIAINHLPASGEQRFWRLIDMCERKQAKIGDLVHGTVLKN